MESTGHFQHGKKSEVRMKQWGGPPHQIQVSKSYRDKRKNKLKRTFMSASDAAEDRAKGVKRQGGVVVDSPPAKNARITFVPQGHSTTDDRVTGNLVRTWCVNSQSNRRVYNQDPTQLCANDTDVWSQNSSLKAVENPAQSWANDTDLCRQNSSLDEVESYSFSDQDSFDNADWIPYQVNCYEEPLRSGEAARNISDTARNISDTARNISDTARNMSDPGDTARNINDFNITVRNINDTARNMSVTARNVSYYNTTPRNISDSGNTARNMTDSESDDCIFVSEVPAPFHQSEAWTPRPEGLATEDLANHYSGNYKLEEDVFYIAAEDFPQGNIERLDSSAMTTGLLWDQDEPMGSQSADDYHSYRHWSGPTQPTMPQVRKTKNRLSGAQRKKLRRLIAAGVFKNMALNSNIEKTDSRVQLEALKRDTDASQGLVNETASKKARKRKRNKGKKVAKKGLAQSENQAVLDVNDNMIQSELATNKDKEIFKNQQLNVPLKSKKKSKKSAKNKKRLDIKNPELLVAITLQPSYKLTSKQSQLIIAELSTKVEDEAIRSLDLGSRGFAPTFRGRPFLSKGVIKIWCENEHSLTWLQSIIKTITSPVPYRALTIIKQSDLENQIKIALLLPNVKANTSKELIIHQHLLISQNSWCNIAAWRLLNVIHEKKGLFLILEMPVTDIPALMNRQRRKYQLKEAQQKKFAESSSKLAKISDPEEDSETPANEQVSTESISQNNQLTSGVQDSHDYLKELELTSCLDVRRFRESMFSTPFGKLVLMVKPWINKLDNIFSSCSMCKLERQITYEEGKYTLYINKAMVAQAVAGSKAEARGIVEAMAWDRLRRVCINVYVREQWIAQGDSKITNSDVTHTGNARNSHMEQFGTPIESNVATKMMKLMGWSGGGLGAGEQGIEEPVKPHLQMVNRAGLGSDSTGRHFHQAATDLMRRYSAQDTLDVDLVFSSCFSKEERAKLHQIAKRSGLASHSYGKDDDRFLVVRKKSKDPFLLVRDIIDKGGNTAKYQIFIPNTIRN